MNRLDSLALFEDSLLAPPVEAVEETSLPWIGRVEGFTAPFPCSPTMSTSTRRSCRRSFKVCSQMNRPARETRFSESQPVVYLQAVERGLDPARFACVAFPLRNQPWGVGTERAKPTPLNPDGARDRETAESLGQKRSWEGRACEQTGSRATTEERLHRPPQRRKPLRFPRISSRRLSPSAKQNPTVALFRYRGVQVAGSEFGPVTAGLWLGPSRGHSTIVLQQSAESLTAFDAGSSRDR